jgi:hypothetical protein
MLPIRREWRSRLMRPALRAECPALARVPRYLTGADAWCPGVRDRAGSVMARPAGQADGPRQLGLPGAGAGSAIAALCCQP